MNPATVIEIYNSPETTRRLAAKYKTTTSVIARIKGRIAPYGEIVKDWQNQMARTEFKRRYGYEPNKTWRDFKKSA